MKYLHKKKVKQVIGWIFLIASIIISLLASYNNINDQEEIISYFPWALIFLGAAIYLSKQNSKTPTQLTYIIFIAGFICLVLWMISLDWPINFN